MIRSIALIILGLCLICIAAVLYCNWKNEAEPNLKAIPEIQISHDPIIRFYRERDSLRTMNTAREIAAYKEKIKKLKSQIIRDPYKTMSLRGGYATNTSITYQTRVCLDSAIYYGQLNKRDSVIAYQDSTISSLETDRHFSNESTAEQIDFLKKAYVESENYSRSLESKLVKSERKASQNITVGPYVGAAYDLGSGGFRPSVGVSAQFKVFGFRVGKRK